MGSGTTAVAAKNLNRNFIGFEINKEYLEKSLVRLQGERIYYKSNDNYKQINLFDIKEKFIAGEKADRKKK